MFQQIIDNTEPLCQLIDSFLAQLLTFDNFGIEFYIAESTPKTLNALFRKLKAYYKDKPDGTPYRMAYGLMPPHATFSPDVKQMYTNGHFCYVEKFAILTNNLGIVRHISFIDDDISRHLILTLPLKRKRTLPTKINQLAMPPHSFLFYRISSHPIPTSILTLTFLGDSAFNPAEIYGMLLKDFHFSKTLIPYNLKNESSLKKVGYNEYDYPTCRIIFLFP